MVASGPQVDASLRWRDGGKLGGTAPPTSAAATAFSCNSANCARFFVNQSFQFLHVFYRINHAVDFINLPIMDIKFLQPLSKPDFSIFR